jgi:hypothetical protein
MTPLDLYGLDVDRCERHGIWFDAGELESTLRAASEAGRTKSGAGEKTFGALLFAAYLAATILQIIAFG